MKLRLSVVLLAAVVLVGALGALAYHSADVLASAFLEKS